MVKKRANGDIRKYITRKVFKDSLFSCAGGPFRHEILETPIKTRKALSWTGQHGFWDVSNKIYGLTVSMKSTRT